jgi:predicted GNAT superfamily acetyltransferase
VFPAGAGRTRVAIPSDIDALLAHDHETARQWRLRVREALEAAFASGYAIMGFAGERGEAVGWYVLERRRD